MSLTVGDVSRLGPIEYLNDNPVDFYLKRLVRDKVEGSPQRALPNGPFPISPRSSKAPSPPPQETAPERPDDKAPFRQCLEM